MIKAKQLRTPQLVLVVDDQEINRDVLGMILEDYYDVLYARDGQEALDMIEKYRDKLSIVLLDLIMPQADGFEVLIRIKSDEFLRRIPVIVLTAEKSAELRALELGAADFITKPFDMHEIILARVSRIIELSEGRQLISAAEHDPLTMLYSRNFFFEYVNRIHQYHPEYHMDAVVIDIEQFHSVNALNGRDFGDRVLRIIGDELHVFLKGSDGLASRVEADRFDIYCARQEDYQQLLNRLQGRVDTVSRNAGVRLRMGVKAWQEDMDPILQFDLARAACSMARGSNKGHLVVYDDDMRLREIFNQRLLNDLHRAVEEHELHVYYQPKYNVQCHPPKLSSAEALIRWKHPELGMISPEQFIPLLENSGLISVVDHYVWEEAASQIREWHKKYGITVPISVNLSRVDLYDPMLEETLNSFVEENGLDRKSLKLEVTESAYTDNADQMISLINCLRLQGFEIEMDDFGSGYSSLNMLTSMPIDVLKMDMRFIQDIDHTEKDFWLVDVVLNIARHLQVPVVAEGVETEAQMNRLRAAGCELIQGYYFSRPLPPEEFEKLIVRETEIQRGDT